MRVDIRGCERLRVAVDTWQEWLRQSLPWPLSRRKKRGGVAIGADAEGIARGQGTRSHGSQAGAAAAWNRGIGRLNGRAANRLNEAGGQQRAEYQVHAIIAPINSAVATAEHRVLPTQALAQVGVP